MAGRPRKPTHLKLIAGNPGKRPLPAGEPQPKRGVGTPPGHMSPRAAEAWPYVAGILDRMGVLTEADALALERLCECYAEILAARSSLANPVEVMRADGDGFEQVAQPGELTYVTYGKGGPMLRSRPEVALIADADRRFRSYLGDFGLTPAARSKVHVTDGDKPEALDSYFG